MENDDKLRIIRKILSYLTLVMMITVLGITVTISQTKQITFEYYGKIITVKTLASTVEEFLAENKVYVNENVVISPAKDAKLETGSIIKMASEATSSEIDITDKLLDNKVLIAKVVEETLEIPYETEKIENPTINRGVNKIKTEGTPGTKKVKYLVKCVGESEIFKKEIDATVQVAAVNKVVEVGTKSTPFVSRSNPIIIPSVDSGFRQYNIALPLEQQQYAYAMCKQYNIEYELFLAMIKKESSYRANAIGGGNSYGLCQIHISNFNNLSKKLGIGDFLDPYDNIKAGAYMLSIYMNSAKKFSGEKELIEVYGLNSYNMGEGTYFNVCYSKGVVHRSYSTSIRQMRDRLISSGTL